MNLEREPGMTRIGWAVLVLAAALARCAPAEREGRSLDGFWEGTLSYPGFETRIVLEIRPGDNGPPTVVIHRPDETSIPRPAELLVGDSLLRVTVPGRATWFEGRLITPGDTLRGQWVEQGQRRFLLLHRVARIVGPARPQTPIPPFPYHTKDLLIAGPDPGDTLAGTLSWPAEGCPCPVAILIPGVGAHDRDYTLWGHRPFLVLADYLARRGVASLRYDERGVGGSTGDAADATSADYATDVLAWLAALERRPDIVDRDRIGLVGHSEGGTIATLAAAQSRAVAFVIMLASPGLPGREYNLQFETAMARAMGLPDDAIAARRAFQERVLDVVSTAPDSGTAARRLRALYAEAMPAVPEAELERGIRRLTSPWFRFNLAHDPRATLRQVAAPVLAVFGELDRQVPPEGNRQAMAAALDTAAGLNRVVVLPGLNHFLQTATTGAPTEYARIEETIAPTALALILEWIERSAAQGFWRSTASVYSPRSVWPRQYSMLRSNSSQKV